MVYMLIMLIIGFVYMGYVPMVDTLIADPWLIIRFDSPMVINDHHSMVNELIPYMVIIPETNGWLIISNHIYLSSSILPVANYYTMIIDMNNCKYMFDPCC